MYKHIMVAIDGSETAEMALTTAIQLAKEQNATLNIVHVFDETAFSFSARYPTAPEFQKTFIEAGKEILATGKDKAHQQNVKAETFFLQSLKGISRELIDFTKSHPTDLIVIGTHGRSGIERLLLGSVAEKLVRMATIPVLLIPGK